MKFHKEGYPTLVFTMIFGAAVILLGKSFAPQWLLYILIAIVVFLLIVVLQFFRDPNRKIHPENNKTVYSPADGKIVVIEKVYEPEYIKAECYQVSIFMSPLNVHKNRNPVSSKIAFLKYHPGKYLAAWNPKSSTENERYTTVYDSPHGLILMRQIAGALARRIVNYLKEGDQVTQSQEMGFIKFGSRVDLFLPLSADIKVKMDQMVKSPIDVIATF